MTQPEISFHVWKIRTKIKTATIADIISVNKVIKFIKNTSSHIKIPWFDLDSLEVHLDSDASFNNLSDGGSQGYLVFKCNKNKKSTATAWHYNKLKGVSLNTSNRNSNPLR